MKKILIAKTILFGLAAIMVLGSSGAAYYFFNQYQALKQNPELIAQQEVKTLTAAIGKFMDLPADETPTLATVTDQEKLKDQEFFANAQNGDKVLIYTNAHKAILYRPATNRVINFAPFNLGSQTQPPVSPSADLESGSSASISGQAD